MIKERINCNKGITIISLVMTIVLLLILTGASIYSINVSNNGSYYYNKMVADINLLNDKVLVYYNKYGEIPKTNRVWERNIDEVGNVKYYEIDLSRLEGIALNYGNHYGATEELTENSDVYLINSNLHIYYLRGVKKDGEIYHFISDNENYAPDIEDEEPDIEDEVVDTPQVEYQRLEYIESSGTQYIDVGFKPNQDTTMKVVCQMLNFDDYPPISNSRNMTTSQYFGTSILSSTQYRFLYNKKYVDVTTNVNLSDYNTYLLDKNKAYFNEELIKTFDYENFQVNYNLYIFADNIKGSIARYGKMRLKEYEIYDNGELIRDLVPCYKNSDNEAGLYDLVNDVFYTNQGTGEFVAGPEV